MIRVRTGRGWRYNPHLLAELRSVVDRGSPQLPIVDVLGLEVDGVDLLTGLAEDRIVEVTADLVAALSRLASGYRRAQVSCSGGAVELLFERRAEDVRVTMVRLRRPSEVLLRDLEIDLRSLCEATLISGKSLIEDLRRIHPRLAESAPAERLVRGLQGALGKPPRPCPSPPTPTPAEGLLHVQSRPPQEAGFRLEVEDEDRLLESFAGGRADLRSLLPPGMVLVDGGGGLSPWSCRGAPFLILKDLVQSGLEMVRAIEQGDPEHELPLGKGVALQFRFGPPATALYVRDGPRGRQEAAAGFQRCEPVPLLMAIFQAALAFGTLGTRRNARLAQNQPLVTLLSDAHEGLAHSREIQGTVPSASAPVARKKPGRRMGSEPKLAPGRLRLLSYRERWVRSVGFGVRQLEKAGYQLLVRGDGGVAALSIARGQPRWSMVADDALVCAKGGSIVAASSDRIARLQSGRSPRWSAQPLGEPLRALALAGEERSPIPVAATDSEVIAFAAESGAPLWRFSPPGATRIGLHDVAGLLVVSTGDGRLYGMAPAEGRLIWRAHGKLLEDVVCHRGGLLVAGKRAGQIASISLASGAISDLGELDMTRVSGAAATEKGLVLAGLRGPNGTVVAVDESGGLQWTWAEDERLGPGKPLLLPVADGLLVRSGRALSRLDGDGRVVWSHPLSEHSHDGLRPVHRRGVVLAAGDAGLFAFDEETGAVLGQVDDELPLAALAIDHQLNVFLAIEEGPVRALRVERFLAVV